eukprot:Protomagalhaensia_wolfi_Nauph_80__3424@NODE_3478_length_787_cov_40_045455_g2731_i0_p1_GENE_NODE_3478_length_787_cov_40_045455_g2731_i0NODE_3478_length_787_cov_40_045455_g2731_i0_p1_ORF_typecomplete_len168_score7_23FtsX/PF02687_21/0_16_NODE_3478_length_787_cov_40_045455_g2731_i0165668
MANAGAWACLLLSGNGVCLLYIWGYLLASHSDAIKLSSSLKEAHAAAACYVAAGLYLLTGLVSAWKVTRSPSTIQTITMEQEKFRRRPRRWNDTPTSRHRKSLAPEIEPLLLTPSTSNKPRAVRLMSPTEFGFVATPGPRLHFSQFKSSLSSDSTCLQTNDHRYQQR